MYALINMEFAIKMKYHFAYKTIHVCQVVSDQSYKCMHPRQMISRQGCFVMHSGSLESSRGNASKRMGPKYA